MNKNAARSKALFTGLTILFLLALPLAGLAAQAATPAPSGGMNWGISVEQALINEGCTEDSCAVYHANDYDFYCMGEIDGEEVCYVFRNGELAQRHVVQCADAYSAELIRMTMLCGVPAQNVTAEEVSALINAVSPDAVQPGDFTYLTGWKLSDGTIAALYVAGEKCHTVYLHEQRIRNGG